MILFAIIAIWLTLITFVVILCRVAATADARYDAAARHYPTAARREPHADAPVPVPWEERFAPVARDLRPTARGGRGRGERYAAGS